MPSLETSLANLEKARAFWRPPRPWRSAEESWVIRHLAWQWFTYRGRKWSGRTLARRLGVHHRYIQKLVREFGRDPARMVREKRACGFDMATFEQLCEAREETRQMAERGFPELGGSMPEPIENFFLARRLHLRPVRRSRWGERKIIWPSGAGSAEARKFTEERLAAGSQMLLNLWYTAWLDSAE